MDSTVGKTLRDNLPNHSIIHKRTETGTLLTVFDPRGNTVVSFDSLSLVPSVWRQDTPPHHFHVYNPSIARVGERLLMAYRVDSGRYPHFRRRLGICELDDQMKVIGDSVQPFSDTVREGGERYYDPRFVQVGDRLFIHYNNSTFTKPNRLYLVEVDLETLRAKAPARQLALDGPRQEIEKNWMFFSPDGEALFAVYWIEPHKILYADLAGTGSIPCRIDSVTPWQAVGNEGNEAIRYPAQYGRPFGGASPVRCGDTYLAVFHSRRQVSPLHPLKAFWPSGLVRRLPRFPRRVAQRLYPILDQQRYYAGIYAFDATSPFRPRWMGTEPVLWPEAEPGRRQRRINRLAQGVVYPCGALRWDENRILVSYGIHDERCALRWVDVSAVAKQEIVCRGE